MGYPAEGEGGPLVGWLRLTRVSNFRQVVGNAIMRYDDKEEGMAHTENVAVFMFLSDAFNNHLKWFLVFIWSDLSHQTERLHSEKEILSKVIEEMHFKRENNTK